MNLEKMAEEVDVKLFNDLALIKIEIKNLKKLELALVTDLTDTMNSKNLGEVKTGFGVFSFTTRKKYEYPVYVTELEKTFKSKKKEAELNGDAKFEENTFLTFRSKDE